MSDITVASTPNPVEEHHNLEFRGNAKEYFRIWIVNIALTLVTLGIYSAWAKVRTRRYFLGHTVLHGHGFDYHADPVRILYGRLILAALGAGVFWGSLLSPIVTIVSAVAFFLLFPWLVVKGMAFNLANTSYRNIRFGFAKNMKESYLTHLKCLLTIVFTLGLGSAWAIRRFWNFRLTHSRYGTSPFTFSAEGSDFFGIYFLSGCIYIGFALIAGILGFVLSKIFGSGAQALTTIFIYIGLLYSVAYARAKVLTLVCRHTRMRGGLTFDSRLEPADLFLLYLTNILACVFTLGLAIPWAMIRLAQYRISHITVNAPAGALDTIVAGEAAENNAVGDAALDFWDVDLGF